jgi:hypothetical protein
MRRSPSTWTRQQLEPRNLLTHSTSRSPLSRQPSILDVPGKPHGTLYIGSTSDLTRRALEHKAKMGWTVSGLVRALHTFEPGMQRERRAAVLV